MLNQEEECIAQLLTTEQIHELKCWPEYFKEQIEGHKNFEIRFYDRSFNVGDVLFLREFTGGEYTGRFVYLLISYMLTSKEFKGIADGYAILSTKVLQQQLHANMYCI